jgi:hypothetical protein
MRRAGGVRWVVAILAAAAGLGGLAQAQNREKAWEVTPYIGYVDITSEGHVDGVPTSADSAVLTVDSDYMIGFRFAYHWTKKHEVEFAFQSLGSKGTMVAYNSMSATYAYEEFQQDILTGRADYIYNIPLHRRGKVVAFLTAGLGIVNISTFGQSGDADLQLIFESFIGDENVPMYDFGAGIRIFGSPKVGVRFDARRVAYSSDDIGDQSFTELTVGVCLILGGA